MAFTAQEVSQWLQSNPGLSDTQVAAAMDQFNVSPALVAQATGVPVAQVAARYEAAGGTQPVATGGMFSSAGASNPVTTTAAPTQTQAAAPLGVKSGSGAYGFQNGAPILNAAQLKSILGNEMSATQSEDYGLFVGDPKTGKYVGSSQADTLGWNLSSKFGGAIKTGAALYGVEGSMSDLKGVLAAQEAYDKALQAAGGNVDAVNKQQFFNQFTDSDGNSMSTAYSKLNDNIASLKTAAQQLGIDPNLPPTQLLDQVNQKENRVAVIGRTNSWGSNAPSGASDKQHATVIYTPDAQGKLVAASPVETFNFGDPKAGGAFSGAVKDLATSGYGQVLITAAMAGTGTPFMASALQNLGLNEVASQAIARGLANGITTGVITGDAEKGVIAGLLSGAGSYALNSGALGDVMDKIGLGDYRTQFNIPSSANITGQGAWLGEGVPSGIPGWDTSFTGAGGVFDPAFAGTAGALGTGLTVGAGGQTGLTAGAAGQTGLTAGAAGTGLLGTAAGTLGGAAGTGLLGAAGNALGTGLGTAAGTTLGNFLTGAGSAAINYALLDQYAREASQTGQNLQNIATQAGAASQVPFTPYTVTTGAGSSTVGPNGATAFATQPYQDIRSQAQQRALQALGAINPAQASQTMFGQLEALAAPGRERDQIAMQDRLARQGLLGFGTNLPTVGGQTRTINPLMESLLSAQETARGQQALNATQFGTQEAQRLQQLSAGLQGQAQNVDTLEQNMLTTTGNLGLAQNQVGQQNAARQLQATLTGLGYRTPLEQEALAARMGAVSGIGNAAQGALQSSGVGNILGGLLNQGIKYLF